MKTDKKLYFDAQKEFDKAFNEYTEDNTNKKAWDMMWKCIQSANFNIINRMTKHSLFVEDANDYATDVTCSVMQKVRDKGAHPTKLTSYCYLPCLQIFAKQKQFEDSIIFGEVETDENGNYHIVSDREECNG